MIIKSKFLFRFFVWILFIVSFKRSYSQYGNIRLDVMQVEFVDSIPFEARLYSADNSLIYKCNMYDESIIFIDSIKQGDYFMEIFRLGVKGLTVHHINVRADYVTNVGVDLSSIRQEYKVIRNNKIKTRADTSSDVPNFAFSLQTYQPGMSSQKEIVNNIYALGFRVTPLYHSSKYYGIGAHIGSNIGFCSLQKNKVNMFKDTFDLERYFYWKVSVALNNRFVFVQPKEGNDLRPCFLDLSIGYNLPITYRYTGAKKESKSVSRYITNFHDFSAMARLGFGFLSFTAEYRLTNDFKSKFPNVPPFMLGLDFIIPND